MQKISETAYTCETHTFCRTLSDIFCLTANSCSWLVYFCQSCSKGFLAMAMLLFIYLSQFHSSYGIITDNRSKTFGLELILIGRIFMSAPHCSSEVAVQNCFMVAVSSSYVCLLLVIVWCGESEQAISVGIGGVERPQLHTFYLRRVH